MLRLNFANSSKSLPKLSKIEAQWWVTDDSCLWWKRSKHLRTFWTAHYTPGRRRASCRALNLRRFLELETRVQWNARRALAQQHAIILLNIGIPVGVNNVCPPVVQHEQVGVGHDLSCAWEDMQCLCFGIKSQSNDYLLQHIGGCFYKFTFRVSNQVIARRKKKVDQK